MIVYPAIVAMAHELNEAWEAILDKHLDKVRGFAPFGLEMTTVDGVTARFYEEGIEFYPKIEKDGVCSTR